MSEQIGKNKDAIRDLKREFGLAKRWTRLYLPDDIKNTEKTTGGIYNLGGSDQAIFVKSWKFTAPYVDTDLGFSEPDDIIVMLGGSVTGLDADFDGLYTIIEEPLDGLFGWSGSSGSKVFEFKGSQAGGYGAIIVTIRYIKSSTL